MKFNIGKIIKVILPIIILLIIALLIIFIPKDNIKEFAKNKIEEQTKAQVQSGMQSIIDETKQQVQQNEFREATLSDLKLVLKEKGYVLDIISGDVEYKGYMITINEDLTISNIEEIQTKAYYEVISVNGDNLNILLTIENSNGIEKITGEDINIEGNGKKKVAIDRTIKEGDKYQLSLKLTGKEKEELYTLVASTKPDIIITNENTLGDGTTKTVQIQYPTNENLINYYSIDGGDTWYEYSEEIQITTTGDKKIIAKSIWKENQTIFNTKKDYLLVGDSLISITDKFINDSGYYTVYIKDEKYTINAYVLEENTVLQNYTIYGNEEDVATASTNAKNMVVVKAKGNLTVNSGATVTAYRNNYGGPKGMLLYVEGKLINNGTITMTSRGAKAAGQNIYLWKNENETYEYVPSTGASGGAGGRVGISSQYAGAAGATPTTATARRTGGGGGAAGQYMEKKGGSGSSGTSYSGGSGGGGGSGANGSNASGNGGAGGKGNAGRPGMMNVSGAGGGAGNPGGIGASLNGAAGNAGANGTGGLLIIYSNVFENNSVISSNGSAGGSGNRAGGGGSGGGSINIFYNTINRTGTITATGGAGGAATRDDREKAAGAKGGDGCVSAGSIATGSYR